MSNLTFTEKRHLENALGMNNGYVLNFTNRSIEEFLIDNAGIEIYNSKYEEKGNSKANRLRVFWDIEDNYTVGKVLHSIFENWDILREHDSPTSPPEQCIKIATRLKDSATVPDLDIIQAISNEKDFETLAKSIRESIERNEPENGLDRLHTFLMKYLRVKCKKHGIIFTKEKPLHSLMGEYIKHLKKDDFIESEMTEIILKSSISVIEKFNFVRNNQSYAHDNNVLNYNESILIFGYITNIVKFIEKIESSHTFKTEKESSSIDF